MSEAKFSRSMLHPRWWPTWLAMAFFWLVSLIPYGIQVFLGKALGRIFLRFATRRRMISERNLALCFPEFNLQQRAKLLKESFESTGVALFEVGIAWFWPHWRLHRLVTIDGLEHLHSLDDEGALLMAVHFTTLEIGAAFVSMNYAIDGMYRPHKNPVFNFIQRLGRERHHSNTTAIARRDVRGMLRALKRKHVVWYAPDQDYGPKQSVFAPFFGVTAASVTATSKFSRMTHAKVIPFTQVRLDKAQGYKVTIYPPLENFPGDDDETDAIRINNLVEQTIRQHPGQYLWSHRRFKTRPPGENDVYGSLPKKRQRTH
ncbi:MAG: LpxL/LpxP family Kdo(2)-lipid IV(A) lauroyl/palmitoleoyl acyltransferase [Pseudomonadales bacterium]